MAIGMACGLPAEGVGHALGVASGAAALAATFALTAAALPPDRRGLAGLAPWLVLSATGFSRWSTSGLETPLFAAAGAGALAAEATRRTRWALAALVVASLTRPEGVLLAGVVLASQVARARAAGSTAAATSRPVLAYGAFLAALTGFRLLYYGSPVPNTFYAKVGGVPVGYGIAYVASFLRDGAAFLLPPALVAAFGSRRLRCTAAYTALVFAYVIAIGAEAFAHWRFLVPVLPCLAALATVGAARAWRRSAAAGAISLLCLLLAVATQVMGGPSRWLDPHGMKRWQELSRVHRSDRYLERKARMRADRVLEQGGESALVASVGIGKFGWFAPVRILDLVGLVDPVVARSASPGDSGLQLPGHQRSASDYVFARRPDYILIPRKDPESRISLVPAVRSLWSHPDLERHYRWDEFVMGYRRID